MRVYVVVASGCAITGVYTDEAAAKAAAYKAQRRAGINGPTYQVKTFRLNTTVARSAAVEYDFDAPTNVRPLFTVRALKIGGSSDEV